MPPRKRSTTSSGLLKISQPQKPKTIEQLYKEEQKIPPEKRGPADPAIVQRLEQAITQCRCLDIVYALEEGRTRVYCPTAIGLQKGRAKALGMDATPDEMGERNQGVKCLYVAGIESAALSDAAWMPTPGDLNRATCFDHGRIQSFSECPEDDPGRAGSITLFRQ